MRLPNARFSMRRMMVAVAVVALLLGIKRWIEWDPPTSFGIGNACIPLVFIVRDANTGELVEGATIRLQDPDWPSVESIPPYVLNLKTGRDGQASFVFEASVYMVRRSSPVWDYRVRYPAWEMRITAEGYQESTSSFAGYEDERGGGCGFHKGALPPPSPPIVTRLRKQTQAETL